MKILLIEDNKKLAESLEDFLKDSYQVTNAPTAAEGLELAKTHNYDLIVLDLGLPDIPGEDVCRQLRRDEVTTPILVLTAVDDVESKVLLFKCGADDYLTKPFKSVELQARLQALLRRGHFDPEAGYTLKVASLRLDPVSREVERSGKRLKLRRKEFDILEYLVRNQGKVVTRSMILNNIWDGETNSWNNTVTVHIKCLRDKVDRPFKDKLIKTVYGLGYTIDNGAARK